MSSMTIFRDEGGAQLGYAVTRQRLTDDEREALAATISQFLAAIARNTHPAGTGQREGEGK